MRNLHLTNVNILNYSRSRTNIEADKEASRLITQRIHKKITMLLQELGSTTHDFEDTFKLRVKEGSHLNQALPRRVAYALQEPLQDDLDRQQKQENCTIGCEQDIRLVQQFSSGTKGPMARYDYAWIQQGSIGSY